ncbi:MAG: ComEA family DNA-binding protein [Deinococcota bacterium]
MTEKQETMLTMFLTVVCLGLASLNIIPRLHSRPRVLDTVQDSVQVAVQGEVISPGVYTLAWGATVSDLVTAAGGLTRDADPALVNLAAVLDASSSIFIPSVQTSSGDRRISINNSTPDDLERLPGIGPALAGRIVAARPFSTIDELLRVSGIGERTLERLRPLVTL